MRKTSIKKISCLLIAILMCSTFFMSCGKKKPPIIEDNKPPVIVETKYDFIKDGATDYKIVIPENYSVYEKTASDEIKTFLYKSAKVLLDVVFDSAINYSAQSRVIAIGNVSFLNKVDVVANVKELGASGFRVKTVDTNVFILGSGDLGNLYGAYEFLNKQIEFETYAFDEIHIKTNVENMKLLDLNITDFPDIAWRNSNGPNFFNFINANRMKANVESQIHMSDIGQVWHNSFLYFPKAKYEKSNANYYSLDGTQLCFTARGESQDVAVMQDILFNKMKSIIESNFARGNYLEMMSFTIQDNNTWCNCASCNKIKAKYGANSATYVRFINPVAKKIDEWVQSTYKDKKVKIIIFAYNQSIAAPVKMINNVYTTVDDSVIPADNVNVCFACSAADYGVPYSDAENKIYYDYIKSWGSIAKSMGNWLYSTNFDNYTFFNDSINSMQENYRLFKSLNSDFIFDMGAWNENFLSGWESLKLYLQSKLQWNVDEDMEVLISNFCDNFYGAGGDTMEEMLTELRVWYAHLRIDNGYRNAYNYHDWANKKHWPIGVIEKYLGYIAKAKEDIAYLKDIDPIQYGIYEKRITSEGVMFNYLLIVDYGATLNTEELKNKKAAFISDVKRLGIEKMTESVPIDNLWKNW